MAAWDGDADRYAWARRGGKVPPPLQQVMRGQGLFLWVGGSEPVQWTRPASAEGMLLALPKGSSLVGWAGLDGTPIADAVVRFGAALLGVSTWNAETQKYERYTRGEHDSAEVMAVLNHGDALWLELSDERRWWQSRPKGIEFVLDGDARLTEEQESEYRQELEHVQAFFLERYGIEPPEFSVHFTHGPDYYFSAGGGRMNVAWPADAPLDWVPWAHEYFHLLQSSVRQGRRGAFGTPPWLVEGSATYAGSLYGRARWLTDGEGYRWSLWSGARGIAALAPLENFERFHATSLRGYSLGALATDWLVRREAGLSTDHIRFTREEPSGLDAQTEFDSYIQYFRLLASSTTWRQAFVRAFGIEVDEFYEAFEEYRRGGFIHPPPHLSDGRDEPLLRLVGSIPPAVAADIEAAFEAFQTFFSDRLGAGSADYTVYVATDGAAGASAYEALLAEDAEAGVRVCSVPELGLGAYVALSCYDLFAATLATQHFYELRTRLAPRYAVPIAPGVPTPWGPHWLQLATIGYMTYGGRAAAGIDTLEQIRAAQAAVARRTTLSLSSMQTTASVRAMEQPVAEALGFLAGDWLVRRAGERALFKYYELLPASGNWQEAFSGAFGISVADFYAAFEAYRSELVPLLPHLADDRDEPLLLSLGAVPASTQGALRAKLGDVQTLFRERFGTEPVDYTLYVTADLQSAADTYRRTVGRELTYLGCWQGHDGVVLFVSVACATASNSPDPVLELHYDALILELAPWASLPRGSGRADRRGPWWLGIGSQEFADSAYRARMRPEAFDWIRSGRATVAGQTESALRNMETYRDFDVVDQRAAHALSFLAADWLAQRAGEPALFEYYRLLPSSDTWQDAFEGAFGITIDDFYQEFAAYRAAGFES